MRLTSFDVVMWAASFFGHVSLLAVILYKKRQAEFPVFTGLMTFNIVRTCVLYLVHSREPSLYFGVYWSLAALDGLFGFAILFEIAWSVFRPVGVWASDVRLTLWGILILSLGIGVLVTSVAAPPTLYWIQAPVIKGKFLAALLITEMAVGMMSLSARAGLAWKTHVARICQGLGIYSGFCVIADAIIALHGTSRNADLFQLFSHVRIVVYLACLVFWTVALWSDAPEPREMPEAVLQQLKFLQRRLDGDLERLRAWK